MPSHSTLNSSLFFVSLSLAQRGKRLRTTNMQERLNEEIRRRERVIRIFPNDDSALRLIGALLSEFNEQWMSRRYLDMDEFNDWVIEQENEKSNVLEIKNMKN